uniref:Uncharacterized protein n=1 Tax=Anguilla anguilla TaxID=7936 RepID=A0A0E9W381_ANGAN
MANQHADLCSVKLKPLCSLLVRRVAS